MDRPFTNVYDDETRARAYSELEFPGTYWLAFRDLPELLARHVRGRSALDFGCGAGRSTRFLKDLGFRTVGVDVSDSMLREAARRDPDGEYLRIPYGDLAPLKGRRFDLVLCAFTFDNVPDRSNRARLFRGLGRLLDDDGRIAVVASAADIYVHEWLSFSTREFPENRAARPGERVRIVMLDVPDRRPVEDVFWTDADYRDAFAAAGLDLRETHRPLGRSTDPFRWRAESEVSPWAIYVAGVASRPPARETPGP